MAAFPLCFIQKVEYDKFMKIPLEKIHALTTFNVAQGSKLHLQSSVKTLGLSHSWRVSKDNLWKYMSIQNPKITIDNGFLDKGITSKHIFARI